MMQHEKNLTDHEDPSAIRRGERRRWLLIGGGAGALLVLLCLGALPFVGGCFRSGASQRLARHFDLADVSTPESIEAGLLRRVPVGTPKAAIYEFLEKSGIGKDRLSSYYPPKEDPVIVCRIEFDPETFGFVKEHYGILFHLDGQERLQAIEVLRWQTGL